jgi:hypothetical protein
MNLYERMQRQSKGGPSGSRTYSFQGNAQAPPKSSAGRFRARSSQKQEEAPPERSIARFKAPRNGDTKQRESRRHTNNDRTPTVYIDDTDRPYAYGPPEVHQEGEIYQPPTVGPILKDLGLRMLEVAIAAIASEIAYFFTRRRFYGRR